MNLDDVARELGNACTNRVTGIRKAYDHVPKKITPPCLIVALGRGEYDESFGGALNVNWRLLLVVSQADAATAQSMIREFCAPTAAISPKSIKAAIEADDTLAGTVDSVMVTGWNEPEHVTIAGTDYAAVEFEADTL